MAFFDTESEKEVKGLGGKGEGEPSQMGPRSLLCPIAFLM